MFSAVMKRRVSRFQLLTLAIFLTLGGGFVGLTQRIHVAREKEKQAQREAEALATAEELRRKMEEPELPFEVQRATLKPEGDSHWLLELLVTYRNEGKKALVLENPVAAVTTESGEEVPEFFLALEPRPVVDAGSEEEVALRYWLDRRLQQEELWLEIAGDRLELDL